MKDEAVNSRRSPSLIPQTSSLTRVILGTLLVLAGLLAAVVTVLARRENENGLAGAAAVLSLLIAVLLTIFIVPLRNTRRALPSFSILVEARGPASEADGSTRRRRHVKRLLAYFSYVPHRSSAEQRVEQLFPTRGHVLIDGFELSTRFPFGF